MTPTVDVIVPCFNYGKLLEGCVRSILSQEGVAVRVLIRDDASSDETEEVGRRLARSDRRVEYHRQAFNQGNIATYNEALSHVTAEYCLILSADDLLTSGALARATWLMSAYPRVGLTYGPDVPFRDAPPSSVDVTCGESRIIGYLEFLRTACRLGHTGIQAPTVLVRTSLHRKIGTYLPELPHSGDTEIWLRMAASSDVGILEAPQAFRRLHGSSMSTTFSPLRRLEAQKKAFDAHFLQQQPLKPEVEALRPVVDRTIAEAAFWSAAQAFDAGDAATCEAFLAFACRTSPDIVSWDAWKRLRWKRRLGASAWRWLEPLAERARGLTRTARAAQ